MPFTIKETVMSRAPTEASMGDLARLIDRRPFQSPLGLKLMVPGWAQFSWGQHQRGWVLFGSFLIALLVGLWSWGTGPGWAFFGFAFVTHVVSAIDALRQSSFPTSPGRTTVLFVSAAFGLVFYLPAFGVLSLIARPGFEPEGTGSGFLVNCWAYHGGVGPREGQWIWMRLPASGQHRAGRVVAVSGQDVEWTGQRWRVDGRECPLQSTLRLLARPQPCRFKVPSNQVLVEPDDDGARAPSVGSLVLVSPDRIIGRAWAQFYPVWDRHLL
jgi:hypothetical protein